VGESVAENTLPRKHNWDNGVPCVEQRRLQNPFPLQLHLLRCFVSLRHYCWFLIPYFLVFRNVSLTIEEKLNVV
jgi:hypothetical protein